MIFKECACALEECFYAFLIDIKLWTSTHSDTDIHMRSFCPQFTKNRVPNEVTNCPTPKDIAVAGLQEGGTDMKGDFD